ncbi:hypothetical protein Cgig2_024965 [Carnegiea gigantea]|uniref:4Fe-4S Mo/W bis-MGD-type domain-containing protein n=1 Tax=Carnegiea gigantea TaxID=171969 RepID=A0A9Q1Q547_9CARY|nr:hypothetical protein Cgig2_024965 [Carnegiea gigantea]
MCAEFWYILLLIWTYWLTRCVRFTSGIAATEDLGMLGLGSGEEVGTYAEKLTISELSGQVGSKIQVGSRGPEDMHILPRLNEDVNEEWVSDKTRFCYYGLKRQRLNDPMIHGPDGRFKAVSLPDAFAVVAAVMHQVKPEEIVSVAGKLSAAESMMPWKDLLNKMGSNSALKKRAETRGEASVASVELKRGEGGKRAEARASVRLTVGREATTRRALVILKEPLKNKGEIKKIRTAGLTLLCLLDAKP